MNQENPFSIIAAELAQVKAVLQQTVAGASSRIKETGGYILQSRGKMIRPAIFLCVARCRDRDISRFIDAAASLELVHIASLLHDDVIDNSPTRRGKPTVHVRWDNRTAILTGDYLLARAFELLLQYHSWPLLELLSRVVRDMAEGEIDQAYARLDPDTMEQVYFNWIGKKTAAFFAGCCQAGSLVSGADAAEQELWSKFGYNLGVAFQLTDDLLDYATNGRTGKPALSDLRNRVLTLPLIYTLNHSPQKEALRQIFFGDSSEAEREHLAGAVRESGGIDYTVKKALWYADRAGQILSFVPGLGRDEQELFLGLIETIVRRHN